MFAVPRGAAARATPEKARPSPGASAAPRGLDRRDVDLPHRHHRFERALRCVATGRVRFGQNAWRDLPGNPPAVLAPAAGTLLSAVANNGIPVPIGLLLILR